MDDEFYTIDDYIAHKSCIFDGTNFSNYKFIHVSYGIDCLKQKCDMIDKINENIDIQIYCRFDNITKYPCIAIYGEPP